jgi:hypothetical protein
MSGTFSGVNTLQFTPDNKHAYAYSGTVLVSESKTEIMEFTTTSFYLVGDLTIFLVSDTTDDIEFIVEFDNQTILETNTTHYNQYTPYQPLPIIIPPFTKVTISGKNQGSGSKNVGMNFTGKAQGSIEQFDLEVKE